MEIDSEVDNSQNLLVVIQKLYAEKLINDDQRDQLKEMVFDDDAKLLGLYSRYDDEFEELKQQIVQYIRSETFGSTAQQILQAQGGGISDGQQYGFDSQAQ